MKTEMLSVCVDGCKVHGSGLVTHVQFEWSACFSMAQQHQQSASFQTPTERLGYTPSCTSVM